MANDRVPDDTTANQAVDDDEPDEWYGGCKWLEDIELTDCRQGHEDIQHRLLRYDITGRTRLIMLTLHRGEHNVE